MARVSPKGEHKTGSIANLDDVLLHLDPSDPELIQVIEDANAAGTLEGLEERLTQFVERRLPSGTRLW
jgi:hypothetical protein